MKEQRSVILSVVVLIVQFAMLLALSNVGELKMKPYPADLVIPPPRTLCFSVGRSARIWTRSVNIKTKSFGAY